MAWKDVLPIARSLLNDAAAGVMGVEVRGLVNECWRCAKTSTVPVLVCPQGLLDPMSSISVTDGTGLAYARELLRGAGHPGAEVIRSRWSKTRGESYLSNGCEHCGALFGAFFLNEQALHALARRDEAMLPVVVCLERPVVEWWALECDRNNLWWE